MASGGNPNHDDKGRFAPGSNAISHQDGVDKIGRYDLNHPAMRGIKDAVNRGAFNFTVMKDNAGRYSEDRMTFGIVPRIPDSWQAQVRDDGRVKGYYDPQMATVERDKDYPILDYVKPKAGVMTSLPEKAEPGLIYRGMSYEEFEHAIKTGKFESRGDYNLGDEQKGLTYFSDDPRQAEAYANGFAPWQYVATPDRPAVVVAVKDPGGHVHIKGTSKSEIGIKGSVPTSAIAHAYIGKPFYVAQGEQDVYHDFSGLHEGGGVRPSSRVGWRKVKLRAV